MSQIISLSSNPDLYMYQILNSTFITIEQDL